VHFPREQLTDLAVRLQTATDLEDCATRVRDAWQLGQGPISNMVVLLEVKGVLPVEVPAHSAKLDAFSAWMRDTPVVFLTPDKPVGEPAAVGLCARARAFAPASRAGPRQSGA